MTPTDGEMSLQGRTAIVTGSNRGIGRAIARALAAKGASCVLCARDQQKLASVEREIKEAGGEASSVSLDLRAPEAASQLVEFTIARYGRIDIVVNNAGATRRGSFLELSDEDFVDGFALKYFAAVRILQAAWPSLQRAAGSVVNIAGVGGRTPGPMFAIGGSVNAAVLSLTKSLAAAGLGAGIQVNAVNPGAIRTERLEKRLAALAATHDIPLDRAERMFVETEGVTRIGEPEDIANLIVFVVSPGGRFLHGALIDMDGGATKTL
jgi:NAD(P)-dependent dehydrogenase (short-subunit alcohol dehydrogenase family)